VIFCERGKGAMIFKKVKKELEIQKGLKERP
jgi:hypothetical protein